MGDNDEIINAADLVVGATSAEIVKACYLRRPTLSIVADGGSNHEILRSRGIERMPTSTCGASLHAETAEQVKEIFSQLYPPNGSATALGHQMLKQMEGNQARFYSLDGKNTKRVADVVEGVLHRTQ